MRFGSDALVGALSGSFNKRYVADVVFNGTRVLKDAPIVSPQFTDSGSSQVQFTGSCTIVYQDDFAQSIAPSQIGDKLAPFGTQVVISVLTEVGPGLSERTVLGTYLLTETPSIRTTRRRFNGAVVADGDVIDLTLQDLFAGVQRDRFDTPGTAPDVSSVWKEYQRLTGLPVTRTLTDAAIPVSVAYQEDKLQACYDLATVLDGVAYVTPDGTASMRPNVWPAAVDSLFSADVAPDGTLQDVVPRLSNGAVYNAVVVRGTDPSGSTIVLATAELKDGPLRVRNTDGSLSPYRRVPYYYASQYITTQPQAQAYADQLLPRVSTLRALTYDLVETFNPLREVGDVLYVYRLGDSFTCRITDIQRGSGGTQNLTVTVDRTLVTPPYAPPSYPPVAVPSVYPATALFPSLTLYPG
jgi:hypothetical protein